MRNFGDGYTGRGMSDEIMRLAQNLARTCGYAVFPMRLVGNKKLPTRPEKDGGHGFKDATKDPDGIAWLWQHWPGPLIGIATGPASGISVLDVLPAPRRHHQHSQQARHRPRYARRWRVRDVLVRRRKRVPGPHAASAVASVAGGGTETGDSPTTIAAYTPLPAAPGQ
jgi:hypothetical protein